jgi:alpha-glucosidase
VKHSWWREAVIYQIYPRSFADSDGDGVGDLRGITERLHTIRELGVDAVWLSPFYTSPQRDGGYDVADFCDVDPLFGDLQDFDDLLSKAHTLDLRVIVDLVPNHTSDQHEWFRDALSKGPGSEARAKYLFRPGRGNSGDQPPNNWESVFGGPAWTRVTEADGQPGEWYLHLFDSSQPDLDWTNPQVKQEFEGILRFWLDRGVDGFRVDVAHGLAKAEGLPDTPVGATAESAIREAPYWGQTGVHDIYRRWREVLAEYDGDRILCAEAWAPTLEEIALWVRPDEMHQAFNFVFMETPWSAEAFRTVISDSLAQFAAVGAPSTWVLSNHDIIRHATRFALSDPGVQGYGIGPKSGANPDAAVGLRRARAATALMLALPGSAYLYQGEELGLPEFIDIPDSARQDPTWFRTAGERYGRDGCRVPIPWADDPPGYGFTASDRSWLPLPAEWRLLARDRQRKDPHSTLNLYIELLEHRRRLGLGRGQLEWMPSPTPDSIAFRNGDVIVVSNFGGSEIPLPAAGRVLVNTGDSGSHIGPESTAWIVDAE